MGAMLVGYCDATLNYFYTLQQVPLSKGVGDTYLAQLQNVDKLPTPIKLGLHCAITCDNFEVPIVKFLCVFA